MHTQNTTSSSNSSTAVLHFGLFAACTNVNPWLYELMSELMSDLNLGAAISSCSSRRGLGSLMAHLLLLLQQLLLHPITQAIQVLEAHQFFSQQHSIPSSAEDSTSLLCSADLLHCCSVLCCCYRFRHRWCCVWASLDGRWQAVDVGGSC
jgi:hypothetical protein